MPESIVTVRGLTDLSVALQKLNEAAKAEVLAEGIQAGADVIRGDAAAAASRRTGFLAGHITSVYSIASGVAEAHIGPTRDAFYGGILNQGAVPHDIRPKRASRRGGAKKKVLASSAQVFGRVVHHPGLAARPFLTDAASQGAGRATDAMARAMWFGIDRVLAGVPKGQR
jgi:hypothetical protein